ncbi:MAG: hypothetical protein OEZ06_15460 [Myxococcales bacterium]|nr:hypothetical protein [Myxococcales bacterium]
MSAADLVRSGDLEGALETLQGEIRREPADAKHRIFLFQLLVIMGQWERAVRQLQLIADLEPAALPMVQAYREAIRCELLRAEVFGGRRAPTLLGDPPQWVALMIEALRLQGDQQHAAAVELRAEAFELAPASGGELNGENFEWIADADSRLGPIFEAFVNGRYYWIPFSAMAKLEIEQASDLRDFAWIPGGVTLSNGGELPALIPSRYPGSESHADGLVRLARKTLWEDGADGRYTGYGQRAVVTDRSELALLDIRNAAFDPSHPVSPDGVEAPAATDG